jgi:hypothetical protein
MKQRRKHTWKFWIVPPNQVRFGDSRGHAVASWLGPVIDAMKRRQKQFDAKRKALTDAQ